MSFSFTLGRVFGIPIRVHGLFVALVTVCLVTGMRADRGRETLALLAILFGSVLLHELGHSLVARRLGARILDITLWPLGGLSRMERPISRPRDEAIVAVSGPATNFAILLAALAAGGRVAVGPEMLGSAIDAIASINAALALFNLAPAFPMDGGRALRAALAARLGALRGTELAVRIGRWFTLAALIASTSIEGLFLPVAVVSAFLLVQGWIELQNVRAREAVSPWLDAFRRFSGQEPPPGPDASPPGRPERRELERDLESYRGTLEEFFRERDGGGRPG